MLESFLSKLGASTKITVGVSVSPGVGLEMAEIDRVTNTVSKYTHKPLEYNYSLREISNYQEFEDSLSDLFDELQIPRKSNIVLSIPNVYFGMIKLPILLTDEAITNAIISEVEQSYIFKRQEPVISWSDVTTNSEGDNRLLAYTAIQKNVLEKLNEACENVGCKLVGVENAYASLLKALETAELAKEQMKDNITWNLMVVGQNSYAILSMLGKKVMDYYEEPLALKSFVNDEIYNAITISAQLTLSGLPANYLYIVSETDMVSAEVLSMKLSVDGTMKFLECNKYSQNEFFPANLNILPKLALDITPEIIGATVYPFSDYPLKLNMAKDNEIDFNSEDDLEAPHITIGNLEIELTPEFIKRVALIAGFIFVLPIFIWAFVIGKILVPREQARLDGITTKIDQVNKEIQKYSDAEKNNTFDVKATMDQIIDQNRTKLSYYTALGMSVPSNLWITYYVTQGASRIDVKGQAKEVKSVYTFYKNLKQMVYNSDVKLYKLELPSSSIDDVVLNNVGSKIYDFEVTNMSESELNPAGKPEDKKPGADGATQGDQKQESKPFGFNLFGQNSSQSQQTNTPPPATPAPPATPQGGSGLPNNLEKIEKF